MLQVVVLQVDRYTLPNVLRFYATQQFYRIVSKWVLGPSLDCSNSLMDQHHAGHTQSAIRLMSLVNIADNLTRYLSACPFLCLSVALLARLLVRVV